jgi:hypothetical protein
MGMLFSFGLGALVAMVFGFLFFAGAITICCFMRRYDLSPDDMLTGLPDWVLALLNWSGQR